MKMNYKSLSCQISARKDFCCELGELCSDAVVYAVSRLFSSSAAMCRSCVTESYAMRIATGKGRRSARHSCVVPAALAEIDGNWLRVSYSVDPEGVTIQSVSLFDSYPQR